MIALAGIYGAIVEGSNNKFDDASLFNVPKITTTSPTCPPGWRMTGRRKCAKPKWSDKCNQQQASVKCKIVYYFGNESKNKK